MLQTIGQSALRNLTTPNPAFEYRINTEIERNRKGVFHLVLKRDGQMLPHAEIHYKHRKHEYLFGCNAFMFKQFKHTEENVLYEEKFLNLFNHAIIPFYWDALEPEPHKYRFEAGCSHIDRRPPPDILVDFCEKHDIVTKGHCLSWQGLTPAWLPDDTDKVAAALEERIAVIAERYGHRISRWDVCNEVLQWNPLLHKVSLPPDHAERAFRTAAKYFPETAHLIYNEGPWVSWNDFHGEYTPPYLMGRYFLEHGFQIRGMGLQYHLAFYGCFDEGLKRLIGWGEQMSNIKYIFAHLDQYGKLGIPLNISEITLPSHAELGDGEEFQRAAAEMLYRIWFSHSATEGIVWWNMVDDTAYAKADTFNGPLGENFYKGGLLRRDFSEKPSWKALEHLINHEWRTEGTLDYDSRKPNFFRGFYGSYDVEIRTDGATYHTTLECGKKSSCNFTIELEKFNHKS